MSSSGDAGDRPTSSQIQRGPVWAELDDGDTEVPACKPFSIREYVFSARSKHFSKNWPFHRRYIQVCMKHGVKDMLPPFESPGLVREWSRREDQYLEHDGDTNVGSCSQFRTGTNEDDEQNDSLVKDMDGLVAEVSRKLGSLSLSCRNEVNADKIVEEHLLRVDKRVDDDKLEKITSSRLSAEEEFVIHPLDFELEDKMLLPEKDGLLHDASEMVGNVGIAIREELIIENLPKSGMSSDIHRHAEASHFLKQQRRKTQRRKVKSRKKRRIVDICAKALPCTLEDLDKKNGTNWALDASVMPYVDPDYDKVKKFLAKGDERDEPSNPPNSKLLKIPEVKSYKHDSLSATMTKQPRHDNMDRNFVASPKRRCLKKSVLKDCSYGSQTELSSQRTKEDQNFGASAQGHQNEVMKLNGKQGTMGQVQNHGGYGLKILRPVGRFLQKEPVINLQTSSSCHEPGPKSMVVHTVKLNQHKIETSTNSAVENLLRSVAQHKRKPRTVKRMKKVDSITSCVVVDKWTQDRSESELFQSEVTDLCYHSPHASVHSSNSYTQEDIDVVELKEKRNPIFPTFMDKYGGNSPIEPSVDLLAMACSPDNMLYEVFQPCLHSELHGASEHCVSDIHSGGGKPYSLQEAFRDEMCKTRTASSELLLEDTVKVRKSIIQEGQSRLDPKDSVSSVVTASSSNSLNCSVRSDHQLAPSVSVKRLPIDDKSCMWFSNEITGTTGDEDDLIKPHTVMSL